MEEPWDQGGIDPYIESVGNILSLLNSFNTLWTTVVLYLSVPMFGTDLTAQFDVHMQPAPTVVLKCLQSVESNG